MCAPGVALTAAVNDIEVMVVGPESMEYPIDAAGFEEQLMVLATSWKGEATCAPFAGAPTVMACPGTIADMSSDIEQSSRFIGPPKEWNIPSTT